MNEHVRSGHTAFLAVAQQIRSAHLRPELIIREIPAPQSPTPFSIAFSAGVHPSTTIPTDTTGDSPYGAGRFVLMYDPESAEEWGGPFRVVCFAQAPLELELGTDPFLAQVAWTWLIDALEHRNAEYSYASGTATKTLSAGFGALATHGDAAQIEIRASWTPIGSNFAAHAEAWGELLCVLAGFPQHEGVASLGAKRAQHTYERGA